MTKKEAALLARIRKWSRDNYATNYGASVIEECYSDAEVLENFRTLREAKALAAAFDDRYTDITNA